MPFFRTTYHFIDEVNEKSVGQNFFKKLLRNKRHFRKTTTENEKNKQMVKMRKKIAYIKKCFITF